MSNYAIQVHGLSKKYRIGTSQASYRTLRETIVDLASSPFRRVAAVFRGEAAIGSRDEIWALKDVSFDVRPGEVVGIIGRNGAGKTTLLKVLSRITKPTEGYADIYGRVGSLLEVGTGFHPELTGRENVYLNGAILGMKRREIDQKFDEIISFAEIEKFLDTPVKFYSSGMYVRLAFAVAAHLEPEILLVDEVLAVGDAAFQKKCLGKMGDVAKEGRTVLFVSHNMGAVVSLCNRCLWLDEGVVIEDGVLPDVTANYQSSLHSLVRNASDLSNAQRYGTGRAKFVSVEVTPLDASGSPQRYFQTGQDLKIVVRLKAEAEILQANVAIIIYDVSGYRLIDVNTALKGSFIDLRPGDLAHVEFRLEELLLKPGNYLLGLWLGRGSVEDIDGILYAEKFSVEPDPELFKHSEEFPGVYQCRYTHDIHFYENKNTLMEADS